MSSPRSLARGSALLLVVPALLAGTAAPPATAAAPAPAQSADLFAADGPVVVARGDLTQQVVVADEVLRPGQESTVRLPLPDAEDPSVRLRPAPALGGFDHWTGVVEGSRDSLVTVVRRGDTTAALVSSPEGTYTLNTAADGTQTLRQVSEAKSDADLVLTPPRSPAASGAPGPGAGPSVAADGTPVVDVLVGYTPAAAAEAGGTAAIEALAALSVSTSNDAFAASGVTVRFALAGTWQSSGASGDASSTTLNQLTSTTDGSYDDLAARRDAVGADLVSLLTTSGGSYCGVAWFPGGAAYGYSVVAQGCAVGNLSFPHELGHNLGATHDRYVESSSYFPGAYGYVNLPDRWRTIMAYNNQCAAAGFNCTRIARFSNPDVFYGGAPTGIPASQANGADNRAVLNSSVAGTVAAYRTPAAAVPGAPTAFAATQPGEAGTVAVTWEPPASAGSSAVQGYQLVLDGSPAVDSVGPDVRTFTYAGLQPGTTHRVEVRAVNASGAGLSAGLDVTVKTGASSAPGAPTALTGSATTTTATLGWAPPVDDGGAPVAGYRVAREGLAPVLVGAAVRSYTFSGLAAGSNHSLSVAAVNEVGTGATASRTVTTASVQTPGAPTGVAATAGNARATVKWTAPASAGSSPITGYSLVRYSGTSSTVLARRTVSASTRSVLDTGLVNGRPYSYRVVALSAAGAGTPSAQTSAVVPATTPGAPGIGTAVAGTAGGTVTATAAWAAPTSTGGSAVTGYVVRALRTSSSGSVLGTTTSARQPATARSLAMTLPVVGTYRFTVQAVNAVGTGVSSSRSNLVAGR